jgi:hypothetical protein
MNKVKQGHTKYKTVVYEPGKIEGYDDRHVAAVYTCFVTKVTDTTVYYTTERGHYMCGKQFWKERLFSTYRKAMREARQRVEAIDRRLSEG